MNEVIVLVEGILGGNLSDAPGAVLGNLPFPMHVAVVLNEGVNRSGAGAAPGEAGHVAEEPSDRGVVAQQGLDEEAPVAKIVEGPCERQPFTYSRRRTMTRAVNRCVQIQKNVIMSFRGTALLAHRPWHLLDVCGFSFVVLGRRVGVAESVQQLDCGVLRKVRLVLPGCLRSHEPSQLGERLNQLTPRSNGCARQRLVQCRKRRP